MFIKFHIKQFSNWVILMRGERRIGNKPFFIKEMWNFVQTNWLFVAIEWALLFVDKISYKTISQLSFLSNFDINLNKLFKKHKEKENFVTFVKKLSFLFIIIIKFMSKKSIC